MNENKTVSIAKKVEAFAMAFIGVFFIGLGTSYFQERFLYRVPRILAPVFEFFGNIGLAIGLLVLGIGLIYWGFTKWQSVSEKRKLYWIIAVAGLAVGVVLANIDFGSKRTSSEIMEEMDTKREAQIEEVRNSGDLNFSNAEVDAHIAAFDGIYKRYSESIENNDEDAITTCENEYMEWSVKTGDIMPKLSTDEKVDLARYLAKLSIQWSDLMMKK